MFYKKHAVKRTVWNFFIYLHNWKLGCPCCGLFCTNSNSGGEENYFHIINQVLQFCCEDLLEKLGSVLWFFESIPSTFVFFSPSPSPGTSSASFSNLNRVSNSYHHQLLSSAAVSALQLLLRALRSNWQPKLTQSTISQVSLSCAPHSRSH